MGRDIEVRGKTEHCERVGYSSWGNKAIGIWLKLGLLAPAVDLVEKTVTSIWENWNGVTRNPTAH